MAVALSFIGAVALLRTTPDNRLRATDPRSAGSTHLLLPRIFGLGLLAFIGAVAVAGSAHPADNPAITLTWVLLWVGGAYLSVLTGDAWWRAIDPWRAGFRLWERLAIRRSWPVHRAWPAAGMGRWPAVALLAGVFWLELVYPDAAQPRTLGVLLLAYSLVTWTGMALYGPRRWLWRGEAFGALFRELGRLAPIAFCPGGGNGGPKIALRSPMEGLATARSVSRSTTVLILLLLAAVSFDGLTATPQWAAAWRALTGMATVSAALGGIEALGLSGYAVASTIVFAATVIVFAGLYAVACAAAARLAHPGDGHDTSAGRFIDLFAPSLLPIGVGYHLAHYFSYLLIQGQRLVPQLSDPFGTGADWLGTADYAVNIGIVSPATVWYVAVGAVVGGHVVAVYAAHRLALRYLRDRRAAALSQLPLIALMIGYTIFSLWLFAQPTTELG
ncbi:MAG: hypothetical protein WD382_04390 [Halofilum sp. (in: g-proteobacteria)]